MTIPSLDGEPIKKLSLRTANTWAPGLKGRDNGILIVPAVKEKWLRIELGKGMATDVSDAAVAAITEMKPAFARGKFFQGLEPWRQR